MHEDPNGPVATALCTPLSLFLAVAAYYPADSHPVELLATSAGAIDRQLFRAYIPAMTRQHLRRDGSQYKPAEVTDWMTTLTRHLDDESSHGRSGSDLDLSTLWKATGSSTPLYLSALLHSVLVAIPLAAGTAVYVTSHLITTDRTDWIAFVVASAAVVACTFQRASRKSVQLSRLDLSPLGTAPGRRRLRRGLALGGIAGIAVALTVGPTTGLALAITAVGGLTEAFADALTRRPSALARPGQLVIQGLAHDLVVPFTYGLVGGIVGAVAGGLPFKPMAAYIGLSFGLAIGATTIAVSPWVRYFVATRILARRHLLPLHPARLLDWAYGAGLVRFAGIFVQFRHRELQEDLTSAPAPVQDTVHTPLGRRG